MAPCGVVFFLLLSITLAWIRLCYTSQVHVVYMGSKGSQSSDDVLKQNHQILTASQMAEMPGVVSVFPNLKRSLHTTHSWDFIGLGTNEEMEIPGFSTKNQENGFGQSPSFGDIGMPEVPSRWKDNAKLENPLQSSCNKKVIGARYYLSGYEAEERSHGLHCCWPEKDINACYDAFDDAIRDGVDILSVS
ncbi:hypothetical protein C4D60_Mb09t17710 [Musa balbisiana]|uniref:Uncharacterized protein n=1 Tax=Musa balbisiana TaxID=52838 RepID=A0A4S8IH48_MUSBA|nr:hypothetical protein C4D60_Mb09t17710 [Musa balbisiana]